MEAQFAYHQQSADLINEVRAHMPSPTATRSTRLPSMPMAPITRSSTNGSTKSSLTPSSALTPSANGHGSMDDYFSTSGSGTLSSSPAPPGLKPGQRLPSGRQPSMDSLHRLRRAPSHSSVSSYNSDDQALQQPQLISSPGPGRMPPPVMPRRKCKMSTKKGKFTDHPFCSIASAGSKKLRKAIYDFQGESADELTFHIGDLITVIEPVDEGWWMGEVDLGGSKRRGIFPVNYTEDIIVPPTVVAPPAMPSRPFMVTNQYIQEEPHEAEDLSHYQQDAHIDHSPFNDNPPPQAAPSSSGAFSYIRPNPVSRSSSTSISSFTSSSTATPINTPLARSATFVSNHATPPSVNRTPPPPPPGLSRSNTASVRSASTSSSTRTPPPPPPSSRGNVIGGAEPKQAVVDCQECGCDDFSVNLFKKGHCNNCFHRHSNVWYPSLYFNFISPSRFTYTQRYSSFILFQSIKIHDPSPLEKW